MNIDNLPVEMLMKIFSYLSYEDFRQISLVNKKFYSAEQILTIKLIRLDSSHFNQPNHPKLEWILNTDTKLTSLSISFDSDKGLVVSKLMIEPVKRVIKKHTSSIKYLRLLFGYLELADFVEILSLIPQAIELDFSYLSLVPNDMEFSSFAPVLLKGENDNESSQDIMTSNEELKLPHLKKLKIYHCTDVFVIVFNRLPTGVLSELELSHLNLDELNVLFKMQTKIKKLTINWYQLEMTRTEPVISAELLNNQNLEYFKICCGSYYITAIQTILSRQKELKTLIIDGGMVDENSLNFITNNLLKLETLSMHSFISSVIPIDTFTNIRNLMNLETLMLRSEEDQRHFEALASLDNSRITSLHIEYPEFMSVGLITALAQSFTNLRYLRLETGDRGHLWNAIMRNFNCVEVLIFTDPSRVYNIWEDFEPVDEAICNCVNPELIELRIEYKLPFTIDWLNGLISNYPNLRKLVIQLERRFTTNEFKMILEGFKNMEFLCLCNSSSYLSEDDLNLLKHKNNLKCVKAADMLDYNIGIATKSVNSGE